MGKLETLEESIAQVKGSMALEGMPLSEEDIQMLHRSGVSHEACEKEIAALKARFKVSK